MAESQYPQRTSIMTLQEAAKYLGIHQVTLYRLIRESDIPAVRLRGQWRFKKDHLDEWLLKRTEREGKDGRRRRAKAKPVPIETSEATALRREIPEQALEQLLPVWRELLVWT